MELKNLDYIQTFTNKEFWFPFPTVDMFCVEDEAHALSNLCRFGGHVKDFYSVAEHAVLASHHVESDDPLIQFEALHHEHEEAYMVDLPTPIKYLPDLILYRTIGKYLKEKSREYLKLPKEESPLIKQVDLRLLMTEKRDLMPTGGRKWKIDVKPFDFIIDKPLPPKRSEKLFIRRHNELISKLGRKDFAKVPPTLYEVIRDDGIY